MALDEARGAAGAQPEGRWALSITLATVAGRAGGHAAQVPAEGQGREAVRTPMHQLCLAEKGWKDGGTLEEAKQRRTRERQGPAPGPHPQGPASAPMGPDM